MNNAQWARVRRVELLETIRRINGLNDEIESRLTDLRIQVGIVRQENSEYTFELDQGGARYLGCASECAGFYYFMFYSTYGLRAYVSGLTTQASKVNQRKLKTAMARGRKNSRLFAHWKEQFRLEIEKAYSKKSKK